MALKALLLKKQIDNKRKALDALNAKNADFTTREAELEKAIAEVETDEQRSEIESMVNDFTVEKADHEKAVSDLEREIEGLENDLKAEEEAQNTDPPAHEAPVEEKREEKRKTMETRVNVPGMTLRDRIAPIVTREEVHGFLDTVRDSIKNKRAINNVGLLIPEAMLGVLRENVLRYSKLTSHITVSRVRGEGRILITGDVPEAVWTECCANLNELSMGFFEDAFGCWMLGGYFVVCNANIEDSDIDLGAEILSSLSQSLGYTNDKTYLYGTGVNMPMGIVPRLAQTEKPSDYPATSRPWADLHTTNIITIADTYTGIALFQQLAKAAGKAKGAFSRGEKVWVMNEATYTALVAEAMNVDASGAIASGVNGTMPVIGGIIEVLPDSIIPNNNIIMGYFDLYRKVERAGENYASSEHVRFLSNQTVFKGTIRWDGKPIIPEGFVLIGINGTVPTTSVTFAADGANTPVSVWLPATASVVVGQKVTLNPVIMPYNVGTVLTWASGTEAKATVSATGEVTGVAAGTSVITVTTANGLTAQCTVTVTAA